MNSSDGRGRAYVRAPAPHNRPQIVEKATLRRGPRGWYLTYNFPIAFRLFSMSIVVPIPDVLVGKDAAANLGLEGSKVPVYVRQYVDASKGDEPALVREDREDLTREDSDEQREEVDGR